MAFRRIEKMRFKDKIMYLHKKGILPDSSYILLDKARETRNKIHAATEYFSEQDYALFSIANMITDQLWNAIWWDLGERTMQIVKPYIQKISEQWLKTAQ
jgi:hypothetical protein